MLLRGIQVLVKLFPEQAKAWEFDPVALVFHRIEQAQTAVGKWSCRWNNV